MRRGFSSAQMNFVILYNFTIFCGLTGFVIVNNCKYNSNLYSINQICNIF